MFCGDGEMDEPESLGAISLGGREKLDNLIFVINCNLQRLDGPVRGNGKIVQELEADFRGAGWNVIKCLWGTGWDALLAKDKDGKLRQLMEECVDGEYQDFKSKNGAYIRKNFFGRHPETAEMVADWTDDQIWALTRGGHDPVKVYAAYKAACRSQGPADRHPRQDRQGLRHGRGRRRADDRPPGQEDRRARAASASATGSTSRSPTRNSTKVPFLKLPEDGPEDANICRQRRAALGGPLPARRRQGAPLEIPPLKTFDALLQATAEGREISTTMAFVRILTTLLRDKQIGPRIVPIVPDESRTFGMEGLFRQIGIFSQVGQLYRPQDADQLMYYREDPEGADPAGGHQRAGRDGLVHRRGDVLFDVQRADDPVLYLLLDVRLPARRRSRLGGGRHARARVPDWRHVGAHDAQRRGAAARGRPQPCAGLDDPELHRL